MPAETAIVIVAVILPFVLFASVLYWGDLRTRRPHNPDGTAV